MRLNKPENFTGDQFEKELKNVEISWVGGVTVIGNQIDINADQKDLTKIQNLLDLHTPEPFIDHRASALAKLAALGLSADEIAAL